MVSKNCIISSGELEPPASFTTVCAWCGKKIVDNNNINLATLKYGLCQECLKNLVKSLRDIYAQC